MGVFPFPMPFSGPPKFGTMFTPASLFAASEPGGWYDPSDLTTLFQDAAATTPVSAVEQPVGLVLDKSKGLVLGSELVTNGDFSNGTTGWDSGSANQTLTVVSGEAKSETTGASSRPLLYRSVSFTTANVLYKVELDVYSPNYSGSINISLNDSLGPDAYSFRSSVTATKTRISSYLRAGPTPILYISATGNISTGTIVYFDNVSVKQVQGNHLSQSTSTARPVLSSRVNLLTYTEQFDNAAWTKQNVTVASNSVVAPDGATTADTLTDNSTSGRHAAVQAVNVASGVSYAVTCRFKAGTGSFAFLCLSDAGAAAYTAVLNMADGTISQTRSAGVTGTSSSVAVLSGGWYLVTITCNAPVSTSYVYAGMAGAATGNTFDSAGVPTYSGSGSTIYIWGADLRPSNAGVGLPAYQRVGAATDYDTTGFPLYLKFDGTDDFLVSGTIDPGSVDKAQVFAGVRKLSDAAAGCLTEFSANSNTNTGTFAMFAPSAAAANYFWRSYGNGSVGDVTVTTYAAPITNVLTGQGAIATDLSTLRVNGAQAGSSSADQGAGNFGSYPLYIGRRGGTSLPSNMSLYSLIVRFSATNMDAATISSTETWVNQKTLAY